MNLWANRIGQMMIASALFFFSCQDSDLLGYKAKNRFNVKYVEIPLESRVFLMDSLSTKNDYRLNSNRLLVGTYNDSELGKVTCSAYSQFYRIALPDSLSYGTFNSVKLSVRYDYSYLYGSTDISSQEISVYELDEPLTSTFDSLTWTNNYFNNTTVALKPTPLATHSFQVNPALIKEYYGKESDPKYNPSTSGPIPNLTVETLLDDNFGMRLFEGAQRFQAKADSADSVSWFYTNFIKEFNGIAIVPSNMDKVVSFTTLSSYTKVVVYFNISPNNKLDSIQFPLTDLVSFNKIESDRSATELSTLTTPHELFNPPSGKRYVENGVGILTQLDFSEFIKYVEDSISTTSIMINSAELVISDVAEQPDITPPITSLALRIINDQNRFGMSTDEQTASIIDYSRTISPVQFQATEEKTSLTLLPETRATSSILTLPYSTTDKTYSGFITLFLQELIKNKDDRPLTKFALFPLSPSIGKSINKTTFSKDNIKLKVYYTQPTASTDN